MYELKILLTLTKTDAVWGTIVKYEVAAA